MADQSRRAGTDRRRRLRVAGRASPTVPRQSGPRSRRRWARIGPPRGRSVRG